MMWGQNIDLLWCCKVCKDLLASPMPDPPLLGAKLRALRRRENLTQVELAERLQISASYLNLIENNRRPLTAPLLIRLAQTFQLDLQSFGADDDSRLAADLLEAFG